MKIFCEDTLTYGEEFFGDVAEVTWFSGNSLKPEQLKDAEALFVRSTTKVNAELLRDAAKLKLVATATSGSDHLDLELLRQKGIASYAAGGCNAIAVAEYVIAGLLKICVEQEWDMSTKSIGIVGAGHVGTALAQRASALGMSVILCDPPLESSDTRDLKPLAEILTCDFISLHVPYVKSGNWPTGHMFNKSILQTLKPEQVLINACRGEVVDNQALLQLLKSSYSQTSHRPFFTVFDVWENETYINFELAQFTDIATQHIAGHSLEGKARGTEMIYNVAAEQFGWQKKSMWDFLPAPGFDETDLVKSLSEDASVIEQLQGLVHKVYDIEADSQAFKTQVKDAEKFRYSRKNYAIRREFASAKVNAGNSVLSKAIYGVGFQASPYDKAE